MPNSPLYDLTADLRALGGGRVWSLMISLFGDLAQGDGDQIDGPVLSSIMASLNVRPEAARVALHRLRNDGWITSNKTGRISQHALTAKARLESVDATPRIYQRPDDGPQDWQLVMLAEGNTVPVPETYIQVQPRMFVGPADPAVPPDALVLDGQAAPDWLRRALIPNALRGDYEKLYSALATLAHALPDPQSLTPLDVALLRCLIVHNWRRLVLKHPRPPRGLIDPSGPYHKCHVIVADLLDRFPRPTLRAIAQDHAGT